MSRSIIFQHYAPSSNFLFGKSDKVSSITGSYGLKYNSQCCRFIYHPGLTSDLYHVLRCSWSFCAKIHHLFYSFEHLWSDLSPSRRSITVILWSTAVIEAVVFVAHLHVRPLGVDGRTEWEIINKGNCYCIRGAYMFLAPLGDLVSYGQLLTVLGVFDSSGHHLTGKNFLFIGHSSIPSLIAVLHGLLFFLSWSFFCVYRCGLCIPP